MSVAKSLPPVDPFFMQECPLCRTKQRMMIKGNYVDGDKWERFPDMGYSFCNCKNIFYTKLDNLIETDTTWNNCLNPIQELHSLWSTMERGTSVTITMLDPYFINWSSPHEMWHWLLRKVYILWDMDSFVAVCKERGLEVVSALRDMDVNSSTPQNFHVTVRKPNA